MTLTDILPGGAVSGSGSPHFSPSGFCSTECWGGGAPHTLFRTARPPHHAPGVYQVAVVPEGFHPPSHPTATILFHEVVFMNDTMCVCEHMKSKHHRRIGSCNAPACHCGSYVVKSNRYHLSNGHRAGIKGKVYSLSQLNKSGKIPPYAEEIL